MIMRVLAGEGERGEGSCDSVISLRISNWALQGVVSMKVKSSMNLFIHTTTSSR